jgi:uncharacterized protein YydD (DUF2326 family)
VTVLRAIMKVTMHEVDRITSTLFPSLKYRKFARGWSKEISHTRTFLKSNTREMMKYNYFLHCHGEQQKASRMGQKKYQELNGTIILATTMEINPH